MPTAIPRYGEVDQYNRWKRERGPAYADQQLRTKHQWEAQCSRPAVSGRDLLADKQYNADVARLLSGLEYSTRDVLGALQKQLSMSAAELKAQAVRDAADDERQYQREQAQLKHIQAVRVAPDTYEGLACVYGTLGAWSTRDSAYTRFMPGCFAKARPSDVRYWFDHDATYGTVATILALWEIGRKELPTIVQVEHPEATGGLVVVRKYRADGNGPAARQWIAGGHVKGISVSYRNRKTTTHTLDGQRVIDIHEGDLDHISDGRQPGAVPGVMAVTGTKQYSLLQGRYKR